MRACVLTQKSEEAPASSASLLATPMQVSHFVMLYMHGRALYYLSPGTEKIELVFCTSYKDETSDKH